MANRLWDPVLSLSADGRVEVGGWTWVVLARLETGHLLIKEMEPVLNYKYNPVKTAFRPLLERKCTCSSAADPSLDRTVIVVFDEDGGLLL